MTTNNNIIFSEAGKMFDKGVAPFGTACDGNILLFYRGIFSNFFRAKFIDPLSGIEFKTSEQYYMWCKALFFGDQKIADKILVSGGSPAKCKQLGRQVNGYVEEQWLPVRKPFMADACLYKFEQNAEIGNLLKATGQLIIVEASPTDRVWGIGLPIDDSRGFDQTKWDGLNLLGEVLMDTRAALTK